MQCKNCGAELPKHAQICPKCGTRVAEEKNVKVIAIVGVILALIGSLLPFAQDTEEGAIAKAFSFMNIDIAAMWYVFLALGIVSIVLLVAKKDKFSWISTGLALVVFFASFFAIDFRHYTARNNFKLYKLPDLLSNGLNGDHVSIGVGTILVVVGLVLAVCGCFIDVVAKFKKKGNVDTKYLTNKLNKNIWAEVYYYRFFYLMFLPVFIMVCLFNYWPMLGVRFAFTKYVIMNPYYVGLKNFNQMIFNDIYFWQAFRNTLFLSVVKLILNTGLAVIISLLLNEIVNLLFKKSVQTIIYLPHFMSWVVVASIFRLLLSVNSSGMFNSMLISAGLMDANNPTFWLGDPKTWVGTFFFINVWKDTGWSTVLFLATLSGVSPDLYEAAEIDGANRWNKLVSITLPALYNTIITVFILNLAKVMNLFESVFVLQNDSVNDVAQVLQTYVYFKTFGAGTSDFGYTTAIGLFKSFVGMILVLSCNYASKKVRGRGIV